MSRSTLAGILLLVLGFTSAAFASAAAPGNLDELLEQTRLVRQREAQMNADGRRK